MADAPVEPESSLNLTDSEILEAEQAVAELLDETLEVWETYQNSLKTLNEQFRQIDGCWNKQRRQRKKLQDVETLYKDVKSNSSIVKNKDNQDALKSIEVKLDSTKEIIKKLGKSKIRLGSVFLRLIIGHVSVKLWNEGERLQFKQEYNRFKEWWLPIFIIFPLTQLWFGWSLPVNQVYTCFTFYYYVSLAIRENILKVNGSKIEHWWIRHHYVSIIAGVLLLLVPEDHPLILNGVGTYFNLNMLWQAMVMITQNQYQRQRHYARKALAKKTAMDLRTTEVIDENPHQAGLYSFLIPALWITYLLQLIAGIMVSYVLYMFRDEFDTWNTIQMWILAICWYILPIGNAFTLMKVLAKKNPKLNALQQAILRIDRKRVFKTVIYISKVGQGMIMQGVMYGMHFTRSIASSAFKMRSKSKKNNKSKKPAKPNNNNNNNKDVKVTTQNNAASSGGAGAAAPTKSG